VKVLSAVGNRPQFIKSAAVSAALRAAGIDEVVLHTGQHYDPELSQVFFDELELPRPAYELDLHTANPGLMQQPIEDVLRRERPDLALVYGDTHSTLAGARAAVSIGVPLAHVEAGLRSGDWSMPEERTRTEVDRVAQVLFCPDERSAAMLRTEGVAGQIEVVGDVMYDLALRLDHRFVDPYTTYGLEPNCYVLATIHREANVRPDRLARIMRGLEAIRDPVVLPVHPRTRAALEALRFRPDIGIVPPAGYLELGGLASRARVIVTDSGGLQKEAYWYGVPCVTTRPSTEWVDTVEAGANRLVDDDPEAIVQAVSEARFPDDAPQLYGDGKAAERLAGSLLRL
jgi:UDP-N-acetylglucosamine 2-epimerase